MESIFRTTDFGSFKEAINLLLLNLYFNKEDVVRDIPVPVEAKEELQELLCSTEFNVVEVKEILINKPWAEQNKVDYCISVLNQNINQLILQSVQNHNKETGKVLLDFDWTIKLILGTSNFYSLNYDIIQLILTTVSSNKLCKNTTYEMKKDGLLKLITLLENVSDD